MPLFQTFSPDILRAGQTRPPHRYLVPIMSPRACTDSISPVIVNCLFFAFSSGWMAWISSTTSAKVGLLFFVHRTKITQRGQLYYNRANLNNPDLMTRIKLPFMV